MKKLIGPVEVNHMWKVEGVTYIANGGVVNPTPPLEHVDQQVHSMGFYWSEEEPAVKRFDKLDKSINIDK